MPITQKTQPGEHINQYGLNDQQRAILSVYQTQLNFLQDISFKHFHFPDALSESYTVAFSTMKINDERLHIVVCLPASSNKAFLLVSDTNEHSLAELAAFCCSQSESNDALTHGYIAELSAPRWKTLREQNWHGYMITSLADILEMPINHVSFEDDQFETCLILLINSSEYRKIKKTNLEEVLTFFKANKRPLFKFKLFNDKALPSVQAKKKQLLPPKKTALQMHKNRSPFAGGQSLAEAVALRQKPAHTDPAHIKKVKHKLQQRLQCSQETQPLPNGIYTSHSPAKAEVFLEQLQQRKQSQKKWRMITTSVVAIIAFLSISLLILTSSPPLFLLIAGIGFVGSLAIAVSAIWQQRTLNL